jgi:prepilin peptidase CpaA
LLNLPDLAGLPWSVWSLWLVRGVVVALLLAICVTDLRFRRIPNRLVVAGLLLALAWQAMGAAGEGMFSGARSGALGLGQALGGAAVAFVSFLVLHAIGVMGAGDVKLMAFLGAVFGLAMLPWLLLAVFTAGGVLAGLRMLQAERRRRVLGNLRLILFSATSAVGGGSGPRFDPRADTADRLPFAVAIVAGALALAALHWFGRFS